MNFRPPNPGLGRLLTVDGIGFLVKPTCCSYVSGHLLVFYIKTRGLSFCSGMLLLHYSKTICFLMISVAVYVKQLF